MDFFDHQDKARQKTGVLVGLFCLAIILIIGTVYVSVAAVLLYWSGQSLEAGLWQPKLLLAVGGSVVGVIALASTGKLLSLRGGGHKVAEMMGGRLVHPATASSNDQQLINVVQEMALASGVPVPLVYVIDGEPGINAFAAGHGPEDAAVVVTAGLLETLNRDELQGVIAHEFSHILNRDVNLNLQLTGLVFGILFLGITGRLVLRTVGRGRIRSSGNNKGSGIAIVFVVALVLICIGYIGTALGRMIQSAVSRQREFLADASAVQFTRNPDGISGALKKIGGASMGSQLSSPKSEEISHFFFASYKPFNAFKTLWATHPPLEERVRRLDPSFDGSFHSIAPGPAQLGGEVAAVGFSGSETVHTSPVEVVDAIGSSPWDNLAFDDIVRVELSPELVSEVQNGFGAVSTTYALLLHKNGEARTAQLEILKKQLSKALYENTIRLEKTTSLLDTHARLPLLDLATPALRQISPKQYQKLRSSIDLLIRADSYLSVFEHSLSTIIKHRLDTSFGVRRKEVRGSTNKHLANLLTTLARIGSDEQSKAQEFYSAGARTLRMTLPPLAEQVTPQQFDDALIALGNSDYSTRKKIVRASAAVVLEDQHVSLEEAEILRAVIEALKCPLPPFLPSAFQPARFTES